MKTICIHIFKTLDIYQLYLPEVEKEKVAYITPATENVTCNQELLSIGVTVPSKLDPKQAVQKQRLKILPRIYPHKCVCMQTLPQGIRRKWELFVCGRPKSVIRLECTANVARGNIPGKARRWHMQFHDEFCETQCQMNFRAHIPREVQSTWGGVTILSHRIQQCCGFEDTGNLGI